MLGEALRVGDDLHHRQVRDPQPVRRERRPPPAPETPSAQGDHARQDGDGRPQARIAEGRHVGLEEVLVVDEQARGKEHQPHGVREDHGLGEGVRAPASPHGPRVQGGALDDHHEGDEPRGHDGATTVQPRAPAERGPRAGHDPGAPLAPRHAGVVQEPCRREGGRHLLGRDAEHAEDGRQHEPPGTPPRPASGVPEAREGEEAAQVEGRGEHVATPRDVGHRVHVHRVDGEHRPRPERPRAP